MRWHSPAGLGYELSFCSAWRAALMGLDQPVQSIIIASHAVMMPSASPPQRASAARLPCAPPGGDTRILAGSPCHTLQGSVQRGKPSLVHHSLPGRRKTFSCNLPSPQGGEGFTSFSPLRGVATLEATPCRGPSLPGIPSQEMSLDSFQEMVKGEEMPPWQGF
jgi:hypothetical protein